MMERTEARSERRGGRTPAVHLDPEATLINVAGLHRALIELGLARAASLDDGDVVLCEWPRYEHFCRLRSERGLIFRLNMIPEASERLHQKQRFARYFGRRPYALRTYRESSRRRLRGLWVEKPFNVDRGEGISFLRDPGVWRREGHVLQRYLEDPWIVRGRKTEVRMIARIDDDGSVRVHREGLVRVAHRPFTLAESDPLIHNANSAFQRRQGIADVEQYLLTEVSPHEGVIDEMAGIVADTVASCGGSAASTERETSRPSATTSSSIARGRPS